jgi:hypothetical protein
MLRLLTITITLLSFVGSAFGQATEANSPKIEVIGPAGVSPVGQAIPFTAKVNAVNPKLTFRWTVSHGTIESGQGTPDIVVVTDENGISIKAEVTVEGLPNQCENTAFEFAAVDFRMPICSLDEFSNLKPNEIRAKMDIFFAEVSNNPGDIGLILLRVGPDEKHTPDNARLMFIVRHAKFRKFAVDRLVFKIEPTNSELTSTVLYTVPEGAEMPCKECITYPGTAL